MKNQLLIVNSLFCLLLFWPKQAAAQASIITNLGPNPMIAGVQVSCFGATTVVANIPDVAIANPGVISLRPDFFSLPGVVQLFIYAHECGHQAVGGNEAAADCWAIKVGRNQGWLTSEGLALVGQYFINSSGDWTHAPGPIRVANMLNCYNNP